MGGEGEGARAGVGLRCRLRFRFCCGIYDMYQTGADRVVLTNDYVISSARVGPPFPQLLAVMGVNTTTLLADTTVLQDGSRAGGRR